jgi:hypothetical protein
MNTATISAGLTPWSRDWVFEGNVEGNPDVKPLFGSKTPEALQPQANASRPVSDTPVAAPRKTQHSPDGPRASEAAPVDARSTRGEMEAAVLADPRLGKPAAQAPVRSVRNAPAANGTPEASGSVNNAAHALTVGGAAAAADAALLSQLNGMSGQVEGTGNGQAPKRLEGGVRQGPGPGSAVAALSGGEFLSTRNGVNGLPGDGAAAGQLGQGGVGADAGHAMRGNLRVIEGGQPRTAPVPATDPQTGRVRLTRAKEPGETVTGEAAATAGAAGAGHLHRMGGEAAIAAPTVEVTGHVTKGAMSQDRLSSESLQGIGTEIRNLSAQGGGEMRIRLKPENLGELHVRVATNGRDVGLHIQASDEKSKRILEESMSHLKESLASQSLNLSKVDLSVAGASGGFGSSLMNDSGRGDQGQQQQQSFRHSGFDSLGNGMANPGGGQQDHGRGGRAMAGSASEQDGAARIASQAVASSVAAAGRSSMGRTGGTPGRLDVRA